MNHEITSHDANIHEVWIPVTACKSVPLREGRAVLVDGREIALFNLGERFFATENKCPHRGGPLSDGILSGDTVVCPLHAQKICLHTGNVTKPADTQACVRTYPTRVEGGIVHLLLTSHGAENEAGPLPFAALSMGGGAESTV